MCCRPNKVIFLRFADTALEPTVYFNHLKCSNIYLSILNRFLGPRNPMIDPNIMILYGIPSKIEQLPYSAAILGAILNCENAKSGSLVHPPHSWTSWSKALKNAKKRLLPNISRFNTPATGLRQVQEVTSSAERIALFFKNFLPLTNRIALGPNGDGTTGIPYTYTEANVAS